MAALHIEVLLFIVFLYSRIHGIISYTHHGDGKVLQALKNSWKNTPATWSPSYDPCRFPWEGVVCTNSRVIQLKLSSMSLKGTLGGVIGGLTELTALNLSYNKYLTGPLPPQLGNLRNLIELVLDDCSFTSSIPDELGNLTQLTNLYLDGNKLSGKIPPSLGKLSKLNWVDLSRNQLSGQLPVSIGKTPGLDLLLKVKGLWLNDNKLSGFIPSKLFSPNMALQVLTLSGNKLSGKIPPSLGKLSKLSFLDLSRNQLSGKLPVSSGKTPGLDLLLNAKYFFFNDNKLSGSIPSKIFSPNMALQVLQLSNNAFRGPLTINLSISSQLTLVNLENNKIFSAKVDCKSATLIMFKGNPICARQTEYCHPHKD